MSAATVGNAMQEQVTAAREQLHALRDRYESGEITAEAFEQQQRVLAEQLLADASEVAVQPARRPRRATLPIVGAGMVVAAAAGWAIFGLHEPAHKPAAAPEVATAASAAASMPTPKPAHALSDEQLERMVDQATAQVRKSPKDVAAWAMLAHSQDMLGKFAESSQAYAKLVRLIPGDAQVLADYADALAVANGRTLAGEPSELLKKALALDPKNTKALALTGTAAFEQKDYDRAIASWQKAKELAADADLRRQLDESIAAARADASGAPAAESARAASVPAGARASAPGGADAPIAGRVILADALVAKAPPDATVFIFARPAQGSRMPVALLRRKVRDLPLDFRLDDSMAMVPGTTLSQQSSVVIGARVSQRGDVSPQPGDLQGWSAPVSPGARNVKLEIGEVLK